MVIGFAVDLQKEMLSHVMREVPSGRIAAIRNTQVLSMDKPFSYFNEAVVGSVPSSV